MIPFPPPPVIPGAVLLYSFMLPPSWRGLFFFLPCAVWRSPCPSTAFFFPGIYFHSLFRFFPCAPRVAFVRLSTHISAGCMALSAALYRTFAALRYAHSRPILQPVLCLCCTAQTVGRLHPGTRRPRRGHASCRAGFRAQNAADLHFGDRRCFFARACAKVAGAKSQSRKSMRERPKVATLRCSLIVAIVVEC